MEIKKGVVEEVISSGEKDDLKCTIPQCGEEFARSVDLNRHLISSPLIKLSGTDKPEVKNEASEADTEIKNGASEVDTDLTVAEVKTKHQKLTLI